MKKRIWIFLLALVVCLVPLVGHSNVEVSAEEIGTNKIITVIGSGEINISPDYAVINVGVQTLKPELIDADKENTETMKAIIKVLTDNGVTDDNMKTNSYYVDKRYDYSDGQKFLGYQVNNCLDFRIKDLENIESLLSKLVEAGANNINGIRFMIEDQSNHYNKALSMALEDAKNKAQTLAGENATINMGEIKEENYYSYCYGEYLARSDVKELASSIAVGQITVRAKVIVEFSY